MSPYGHIRGNSSSDPNIKIHHIAKIVQALFALLFHLCFFQIVDYFNVIRFIIRQRNEKFLLQKELRVILEHNKRFSGRKMKNCYIKYCVFCTRIIIIIINSTQKRRHSSFPIFESEKKMEIYSPNSYSYLYLYNTLSCVYISLFVKFNL